MEMTTVEQIHKEGYGVFGFITRSKETEKIYQTETELHKVINKDAVLILRLFKYKENLIQNLEKSGIKADETLLKEYKDDGYWLFGNTFYQIGIPTVINYILDSYDNKSVLTAITSWLAVNPIACKILFNELKQLID